MIERQPQRDGIVPVRFHMPVEVAAARAFVVGDFNDWSPCAHEMTRSGGCFEAHIPLAAGRAYRFRYLLDGNRWENDWAADAYAPNEFGDDSVIDLTSVIISAGARSVDASPSSPSPPRATPDAPSGRPKHQERPAPSPRTSPAAPPPPTATTAKM